jgi:hypothetical protein
MRITEETITPDDARELLRATEGAMQRGLSEAQVNRIAEAIRQNRWETTHQAIAISPEGTILDGRHRLTAIIRANKAVNVWVARGADPKTFLAVDTGRSRTPGDLLHIAGFTNVNALAATARYVMAAKRIKGTNGSWVSAINPIRHDEIVRWVEMNGADLEHALQIGNLISRNLGRFGLRTWISAGAFLIRESNVPEGLQQEFFARFADGANLAPGSSILAFRRYIAQSFLHQANQVKGPVGLALMIKTFNAYIAGANVQLSIFKLGIERFPAVNPWQPAPEPIEHLPLPGAMAGAR